MTDQVDAEFEAWWQQQPHREQFEDLKQQFCNVAVAFYQKGREDVVVQLPERFDKHDSGDWTYWADGVDAAIEAAGVRVKE